MAHLHVRCPSCAKLYQVDVSSIFSTEPHFQCQACPALFAFDFPPADPLNVAARLVEAALPPLPVEIKKCPRCAHDNSKGSAECRACGVVFERLETLPSGVKTQPSLVALWKELVQDFGNEEKHHAFIAACQNAQAIEYARYKYQEILKLQGRDELTETMLSRLTAAADVRLQTQEATPPAWPLWLKRWETWAWTIPMVIAFAMVAWGFTHAGQRNTVGAGIAVAVLAIGILRMAGVDFPPTAVPKKT